MPRLTTVRNPRQVGFRYTPRRRRSTLGQLFESLIVGLVVIVGMLAFFLFWACIVAAPWVILALVLHLLGVI